MGICDYNSNRNVKQISNEISCSSRFVIQYISSNFSSKAFLEIDLRKGYLELFFFFFFANDC